MKNKRYAGIGSRETPKDILLEMTRIATKLADKDYTLLSGGASGADSAFESGCGVSKEIYLPYNGFQKKWIDGKTRFGYSDEAVDIARNVVEHWEYLNSTARAFHSRNVHQVLGRDCKTPVNFVVCWTEHGKFVGGTATALKLAKANKIPIYNLATYDIDGLYEKLGI